MLVGLLSGLVQPPDGVSKNPPGQQVAFLRELYLCPHWLLLSGPEA